MPITQCVVSQSTLPYHEASTTFPTTEAQRELLESHIEAVSPASNSTTPILLDEMEKPSIHTAIAKMHSEVDMLHAEASCPSLPSRKDSGIELSGDDEGTPGMCDSMTPHAAAGQVPSSFSADRWQHKVDVSACATQNYEDYTSQLSPLSPTFGPRKGSIPTGTVTRRRSSASANSVLPAELESVDSKMDGLRFEKSSAAEIARESCTGRQ